MGMMSARARNLDMRPGVGAELPLPQRGKSQQKLSGHQQKKSRPPEYRWQYARMAIEAH
jgi:hypothetical protein